MLAELCSPQASRCTAAISVLWGFSVHRLLFQRVGEYIREYNCTF